MIVCSFDVKTLSKYDILVLVSNRLYLVLVIGLYTRYGYRNLFTSKGDGNVICINSTSPRSELYRNLFTSKGDGNTGVFILMYLYRLIIETYLPRKGTETWLPRFRHLRLGLYISLSTSRGAGNVN